MSWRTGLLAAAAAGALSLAAQPAKALMTLTVNNGDQVDGWDIVFPSNISITADDSPNLTLNVVGAFTTASLASIEFVQASYTASPTITFATMAIHNNSGQSFGSYKEQLFTLVPGNTAAPTVQTSFNLDDPEQDVFTRQTIGTNSVDLVGSLADGHVSRLGYDPTGGELVFDANPVSSGLEKVFSVKNLPSMGVSAIIPEPTGLGAIGIGMVFMRRRKRSHI
jgi:hypothetical protein